MIFFQQFHFDLCQGIQDVLFDLALHKFCLDFELGEYLLLDGLTLHVLLFAAPFQRIVNDVFGVLIGQDEVEQFLASLEVVLEVGLGILVHEGKLVVLSLDMALHLLF